MTWTRRGDPVCESCGTVYDGPIEEAVMLGWGHWKGQNMGGSPQEHIICKNCRTISRKRAVKPEQGWEDEELPLFGGDR